LESITGKRKEYAMPVYEYRCEACGHAFEKLIFHEVERVRCPECKGEVEKLLSSFTHTAPDEVCGKLPKGEQRELCTECRQGGGACPPTA
jgi:putative FmdB family regulatory protein